jgi:hypothetical protein
MTFNQSYWNDYSDEAFYLIVECLKTHGALPKESFIRAVPYFNFDSVTKESLVKELFLQGSSQPSTYNELLRNILDLPSDSTEDSEDVGNMMTFAQLCFYKVLPCPDANCHGRPREIVTHNQYKDHEFECPFFHHERDRRRICITENIEADFEYKANYYENDRSQAERNKYSLNYFESMFHPLYYKMFRCKREYCSNCHFCPFYHKEQEKKNWDKMFNNILNRDRINYVKDKQKYLESTSQSSSENSSPTKPFVRDERQQKRNNHKNNNKFHNKSPRSSGLVNTSPIFYGNDGVQSAKRANYKNNNYNGYRKGSDEAMNVNQANFGLFNMGQFQGFRAC